MKEIIALHKHWCIADSIRNSIKIGNPHESISPEDFLALGELHSKFMQIEVWYSLIYVVIEGCKNLGEKCDDIDRLLANEEMVSMLRRFRNATFHFQEDPISEKLLAFIEMPESEIWINKLNLAFVGYFEEELNIKEVFNAIMQTKKD